MNLVDGTIYRAIFYTSTPFEGKKFQIVLKNAKKIVSNSTPTAVGDSIGTTMVFQFQQIKFITALKSKFPSTSQGLSRQLPSLSVYLIHFLYSERA